MCQQYKPKLKEFVQNSMTVLKVFIILCPFQWLLLDFQNMHFFFLIYLRTNISLEFLFYTRLVFLKLKELRLHVLFFNIIIIISIIIVVIIITSYYYYYYYYYFNFYYNYHKYHVINFKIIFFYFAIFRIKIILIILKQVLFKKAGQ